MPPLQRNTYLCNMRDYFNKRIFISLLTVAYLFVTLTHISFLQRYHHYQAHSTLKSFGVFKHQSNTDAMGSMKASFKRIDKNLPEKNGNVGQCIATHVSSFFFLFSTSINEVIVRPQISFLENHYRGLSFLCCFRL